MAESNVRASSVSKRYQLIPYISGLQFYPMRRTILGVGSASLIARIGSPN